MQPPPNSQGIALWVATEISRLVGKSEQSSKYYTAVVTACRDLWYQTKTEQQRQEIVHFVSHFQNDQLAENNANAALNIVEAAANADWVEVAKCTLKRAAQQNRQVDGIIVESMMPTNVWTHNLRAAGPVFRYGANQGWIRGTGLWRKDTRPRSHGGLVAVWDSEIYGEQS